MVEHPAARPARGGRKAAWTLVVLAPVCAELAFSGVSMPVVWLMLPIFLPMYGAGVLLVRELVVRAGGGWPSLLLMGVVYELAEDGLGLQALTSPKLYNAVAWGPRVLGFNTTYWESQIGYHVVFSVLIPVLLTGLLFPRHRGRPYLKRGGLVIVGVSAAIGVVLLKVLVAGIEDPGYQAPLAVTTGIVIAIVVLSIVALRVLPGRTPRLRPLAPPRPVVGALVVGAACAAFLGLLMPPGLPPDGADGPAFGEGAWVFVPMTLAAVIALGTGATVYRWSISDRWTSRYALWLVGGALVGRTVFLMLTTPASNDYQLMPSISAFALGAVILAISILLVVGLARRLGTPATART